jgi:hypothetical protein
VLAVTFTARQPACLLLAPPVSVILGWTYLMNDAAISAIGRYIRTELASRLATLTRTAGPVLGWETDVRRPGPAPGRSLHWFRYMSPDGCFGLQLAAVFAMQAAAQATW